MGFLDRFSGIKDRIGFNKDFDINESLAAYYGDKNIKESYLEITKITKKKFKETYDISDELLEKYAKINNDDIQNSLMKKYLKLSMDDLNKEAIEKEQLQKNMIEEEVDSSLEGVDKNTKDQVKKDLEQEQKEKGNDEINLNDKKKEFQAKIYQAAYKRMYSDYSSKVMRIKDAQYESMAVAIGTKEAVEIIAMEKNLEKIDLLYHNHTGKDISNLEIIAIPENSNATVNVTGNTNLKEGLNEIKIEVISEDKLAKNEYIINVTKTKNLEEANTNLETLAIENQILFPEFDVNTTEYSVEVANNLENLNILAIPENRDAKVEISDYNKLEIGDNKIPIIVTASNGYTKKVYNVNVHRRNVEEQNNYEQGQKNNEAILEKLLQDNNKTSIEQISISENTENKSNVSYYILIVLILIILIVTIIFMIRKKRKIKKHRQNKK